MLPSNTQGWRRCSERSLPSRNVIVFMRRIVAPAVHTQHGPAPRAAMGHEEAHHVALRRPAPPREVAAHA